MRDFYAARGRDALVQVELGLGRGVGLRRASAGPPSRVATRTSWSPRWPWPRGWPGRDTDVEVEEDGPRVRVVRRVDGQEIGSGRAALDGDWLGVHALGVEPEHRGEGHATAMMAALLEWGAEQGATTVWLHVETDNEPALALYGGLGFRIHHTNRYLRASASERAPSLVRRRPRGARRPGRARGRRGARRGGGAPRRTPSSSARRVDAAGDRPQGRLDGGDLAGDPARDQQLEGLVAGHGIPSLLVLYPVFTFSNPPRQHRTRSSGNVA